MSTNGSAPSSNERLAQRLLSIGAALRDREKPKAPAGLTDEVIAALAKGLVGWLAPILGDIDKRLVALDENGLAPLHKRIVALEARPTMQYCGVWNAERTYAVGDFVTDHGSMWHCNAPCAGVRPGSVAETWTLAIQHGRDLRR